MGETQREMIKDLSYSILMWIRKQIICKNDRYH